LVALSVVSAAALALALFAVLRTPGLFSGPESSDTFRDSTLVIDQPTILAEDDLRAFGEKYGPMFWAGRQDGTKFELTVSANGTFFVRYLPTKLEAGAESESLVVVTYPVSAGYDLLQGRSLEEGATGVESQSGALVVTLKDDAKRAYFGFPGQNFQVEVYDPDDGVAETLVSDGSIEPVK
jgi:hypothetical protein